MDLEKREKFAGQEGDAGAQTHAAVAVLVQTTVTIRQQRRVAGPERKRWPRSVPGPERKRWPRSVPGPSLTLWPCHPCKKQTHVPSKGLRNGVERRIQLDWER